MQRALLVVDVNNLYINLNRKYTGKLDYAKYIDYQRDRYEVVKAYAYGTLVNKDTDKFAMALRHLNYDPKFREPPYKKQLDWNVEMTLDIVRSIDRIDLVIFGTTSNNLVPTLRWLREKTISSHIHACNISSVMRQYCDTSCEIDKSLLAIHETSESA